MILRKLAQCYIKPGYILGIGVFFGNSKAKKKHRKLITQSHPSLPRWQAISIYILLSISWYFVVFLIHLVSFIRSSKNLNHVKSNDSSRLNIVKNLLYSGLWLGVSPYNFLALKLTETPRNEWENFIFIEEANTWHTHLNRNNCDDHKFQHDLHLLTNKKEFSDHLLSLNIPAVETIAAYDKESKLSETDIHSLCSSHDGGIFIKPNALNAMLGCFEVTSKRIKKNKSPESIHIWGKTLEGDFIEKRTTQESLSIIDKTQITTDIIVQPLLENHDDLLKYQLVSKSEILITFRIITRIDLPSRSVKILSAHMEYPKEKRALQIWEIESIHTESGKIKCKKGFILPYWAQIKSHLMLAHEELESIKTIAWDVCITSKGVKIIEGNFGWNVIEQQKINNKGILQIV